MPTDTPEIRRIIALVRHDTDIKALLAGEGM